MFKKVIMMMAVMALAGGAFADGVVDGVAGALYGSPAATDATAEGTTQGPVDLENIYVYQGATDVFICMTIGTDIGANNWGKYKIFIETNNGGAGLTTDPWGRALGADGTNFNPQFAVSSWVDGGGGAQVHSVQAGAWQDDSGTYGGAFALSATGNTGAFGGIEISIPKTYLGSPTTVKVVGVSTGGGANDNGQDTVPSNTAGNATDWTTTTTLDVASSAVTVPVELSAFEIE